MKYFDNIYRASTALFLLGVTLAISALMYVTFFERPYLSYANPVFKVVGQDFRAGDVVPLLVDRCNSDSSRRSYSIAHSLHNIDTNEYVLLPEAYVSIEPGCHPATSRINVLPEKTKPGEYQIIGGASVRGVLRSYEVTWSSEKFRVVP